MGFGNSKQQSQRQDQSTTNSNSNSSSSNLAYPFLQDSLGSQVGNVSKGSGAISDLLGLNGSNAQTTGFDNFRNSSGYNFIKDQGISGITNDMASKGLLHSGSALKAITQYSGNLANNFLNSYLSNLMGFSNTGLQSGQLLAGAGNISNSSSNSVGQSTSSGTSTGKSFNFTAG